MEQPEKNSEVGLDNLELGNISDYEEDVIQHANEAFFLWEENEHEKARDHLRISSNGRYKYHLGHYAWLLHNDYFNDKKPCSEIEMLHMTDLFLMGIIRGDECSVDYVKEYMDVDQEQVKEWFKDIPTAVICAWLRGNYGTYANYPKEIQCVLSTFVQIIKEKWQLKHNKKRLAIEAFPSNLNEESYMKEIEKVVKRYKNEINEEKKKLFWEAVKTREKEIKAYVVDKITEKMIYLRQHTEEFKTLAKEYPVTREYFQFLFESMQDDAKFPNVWITELYPEVSYDYNEQCYLDDHQQHERDMCVCYLTKYNVLHEIFGCDECWHCGCVPENGDTLLCHRFPDVELLVSEKVNQ
jgi:hypothetical protein